MRDHEIDAPLERNALDLEFAGRVLADKIAIERNHAGLVEGRPVFHAVTETFDHSAA